MLNGVVEPLAACWIPPREGFEYLPLPCARELWESDSELCWRAEYERHASRRKSGKVLTVRDLLDLEDSGGLRDVDTPRPGLEVGVLHDILSWCEGLDEFGSLLWMVLPFEQWRRQLDLKQLW